MHNKANKCGFKIGDPVRLITNPRMVGKVLGFCPPANMDASEATSMPYVRWFDSFVARLQHHSGIQLCKCAMRVPIKTGGIR